VGERVKPPGNFRPLQLGQLLTAGQEFDLKQVRVYTGVPSQERDPQGYRAARKRFDTWRHEGHGKAVVLERNLRYRKGEPPREKGVDVLLAIHLVRLAGARTFQRAIVVSADNDLVPALELVCDVLGSHAVESVSLRPEPGAQAGPPLGVQVTGARPQIHRRVIRKAEYERIEDTRSYNPDASSWGSSSPSSTPGQSGRRLRGSS